MDEQTARRELISVCHLMYERSYVVSSDGNVSVRLDDGRILATPTMTCKGRMKEDLLAITDLEGRPLCSHDLVRDFDAGALPLEPVQRVVGSDGFVILATATLPAGAGAGIDLIQVRSGCQYVQRFRAQRSARLVPPSIASAGEAGFLLLYSSPGAALAAQLFGPRLCD